MESQDRSRSPSRRTSRVEQVVGRWLRRSRDLGSRSHSLSRERVAVDGKTSESSGSDSRNYPFRFNVQIPRDPSINSHGLILSSQIPILVQEVTPGGPADGRLVPGDQLVKINNVAVDDLTPEQAAEIIRECQDLLTMTVLRTMLGPKSSFITPEKRAKLKSNPVKVHFAEEVEVNGHAQGNSLLFLPNVLKVYLENGQTKAFKFDSSTTVKDIVMTLKEKLSLRCIENFSLVLEQQPSVTKLLLLHDEERIQQVVQKKEVHDYRCLFRVCFIPKNLQTVLQEDPTTFEYLYLQGVNDVLQERFAVEMRCNTALRLAALHIQERLASCGQSPKTNLKMITKTWGIENFVSSTLLRNMREKDLRKAIGYHMKKSLSQHDPKQKGLTVNQARINYLEELSDLKSFCGKSFSATMMLQDRESMVTLLVGARYGVSQVVNHKLSILSTLTEFTSITRIELLPESDKVSLVKIYLQDIKPITLLLESVAAKDMSCLIAGYCRVFVDPNLHIFPWIDASKKHKVSAEEGYVSRCGSDSDSSSDLDMEPPLKSCVEKPCPRLRSSSDPEGRKKKDRERRRNRDSNASKAWLEKMEKEENDAITDKRQNKSKEGRYENTEKILGAYSSGQIEVKGIDNGSEIKVVKFKTEKEKQDRKITGEEKVHATEDQPSVSEASDSCHTDSRVMTSPSSDSLDALEEDDLLSCSSSSIHPSTSSQTITYSHSLHQLHHCPQRQSEFHLLAPPRAHSHPLIQLTSPESDEGGSRKCTDGADPQGLIPLSTSVDLDFSQKCSNNLYCDNSSLCFAELSRFVDFLPSPPEASEEDEDEEEELRRRRMKLLKENEESTRQTNEDGQPSGEGSFKGHPLSPPLSSLSSNTDFVFNFDQSDARCYYKLCSNITPDSARSLLNCNEGVAGEVEGGLPAEVELIPILQPPPGFGDSSSDEEFYDARDRFTSPEDPTSGAIPRDICTEMKVDFISTISLSDIRVCVADADKDEKPEQERIEEGGGKALFQFRKRSRKRRSFVETNYTSTVSYPRSDTELKQAMLSNRLHENLSAEASNSEILSSDLERSVQTQNPSPTVSSLTHAEGEPAQLESKPILSKSCLHGPGTAASVGSQEQTKNSSTPTRKREMEMEPDEMEFKSVTDLIKSPSSTITVVRCRVDPDGKESDDLTVDRKKEGGLQGEMGDGKVTAEKQEPGPYNTHMFLPEITQRADKVEDMREESEGGENECGSQEPITEMALEDNTSSKDFNKKNLIETYPFAARKNVCTPKCVREDDLASSSYSPPPPPPSSPLPPTPMLDDSQRVCLIREKSISSSTNMSVCQNHTDEVQSYLDMTTSRIENEAINPVSGAMTSSDEITDSTNSDNVFDDDDDDVTDSLNEKVSSRDTLPIAVNYSLAPMSKSESQLSGKSLFDRTTEANTSIVLAHSQYTCTINSITTKLGAATSVSGPKFKTGAELNSVTSPDSCLNQNVDKPESNCTMLSTKAKGGFPLPIVTKANTATMHGNPEEAHTPSQLFFQSCSSNIMGRLSASTLRVKIQNLPLYLSRSQEMLNQAGLDSVPQSPPLNKGDPEITIKVTDIHDVTQTIDLEMDQADKSVESDDSDSTVTGSDVDGEIFGETPLAKCSYSVVEEMGVANRMLVELDNSAPPVQDEPMSQQNNEIAGGFTQNTPGPITEPPISTASAFGGGSSDLIMDTPGPIKYAPESKTKVTLPAEYIMDKVSTQSHSIPPPIVVTTQNLNGPGLLFHSQPQKARRTSSDRPLVGLCGPTNRETSPSETLSSGCRVFTICEEPFQMKTAEAGAAPPLKPEFSCSSALALGCESVVEGIQMPLDACGCPAVYTNCFSREGSFDEELTVYEFSCQNSRMTQTSGKVLPLITTPPSPTFLSNSSTRSPSFPDAIPLSSSTSELSPLLSPLSDIPDCFQSQTHKNTINSLGQQRYPEPPVGFQVLRVDVDQLLSILESSSVDRSLAGHGGRHPRDTCPIHFTENKRVLQTEARRLMTSCQIVVGINQSPEDMLHSLADSFRTLVELAGICLWFSGCDRCDRRNAEAVAGLADVARSFRDFCLAAERASSKRSCQDLSTKLLAKQCTALTASVFCFTQLFRTLTAL